MKKLFLSVMLVAFAVAVQAGGECKEGSKSACSAEKKAACTAEAKASCPATAKAKSQCCPSGEKQSAKVASPKASDQAKK